MSILRAIAMVVALVDLAGCAMFSRHQFAEPANDWQARNGQLMYRNAKTRIIGEVLVRFSKTGDFELTFSKGPGVTLLTLRQSESFAEVKGTLARMGWSGPADRAPRQLRGWLQLHDKILHVQEGQTLRHTNGQETFLFHF